MGKDSRVAQNLRLLKHDLENLYEFRHDIVRGKEEYRAKETKDSKEAETWKPYEAKQAESVIGANLILNENWGLDYRKYIDIVVYGMGLMKEFNEITDYFNGLEPLPGIENYQHLVCSLDLKPLQDSEINVHQAFDKLLMKWLIGSYCSAMRILKNDVSLILIGGQGVGKTTWLNRLCPKPLEDFLYAQSIDPANKDHENYLSEKLFINLDDCLDSFFQKRGHDELKNFISRSDVDNRKVYARNATKRIRIASIMGSVNNTNFLTDIENRRYLCFEIQKAHWERLTPELIENVWREIKFQVEELKVSPSWGVKERVLQADINSHFTEITPEQEMLVRYFSKPKEGDRILHMQQTDILNFLQGKTSYRLSPKLLSRALQRCKFEKVGKRLPGFTNSRYVYLLSGNGKNEINYSDYEE